MRFGGSSRRSFVAAPLPFVAAPLPFVAEPLLVAVAILARRASRTPVKEHMHEELPREPLVEELRDDSNGPHPRSRCRTEDAKYVKGDDRLPNVTE